MRSVLNVRDGYLLEITWFLILLVYYPAIMMLITLLDGPSSKLTGRVLKHLDTIGPILKTSPMNSYMTQSKCDLLATLSVTVNNLNAK